MIHLWKRTATAACMTALLTVSVIGVLSGAAGAKELPRPVTSPAITREETQTVLEAYLTELLANGSYADFFADDIVVTMMDVGQEVHGRDAAHEAVRGLHELAFDAAPELRSIVYGEGIASAEVVFVGTQVGEFAGVPATGGQVQVPYTVVWELEDGKITDLRLYQLATGLTTQLTALAGQPSS